MSVCSSSRWMHPAACLLARACQRLWLFGSYGAFGGSHLLDISFSLSPPPLRRLQWRRTPHGVLRIKETLSRQLFDPAVTGHADVDRLLRTEPQVHLTPFVLNNHSNSFKSHCSALPALQPLIVPSVFRFPSMRGLCPAPQRRPFLYKVQPAAGHPVSTFISGRTLGSVRLLLSTPLVQLRAA